MKARDTALRLKQFEVDEKARKVADLELMIQEFDQMASDLERQIVAEEERTGVKDKAHFAYSTFAKSAAARRENLMSSCGELREKLEAAQREHTDAVELLARAGSAETHDDVRGRRRAERHSGAMAS